MFRMMCDTTAIGVDGTEIDTMTNNRTDDNLSREALWTFPREWRTTYFAVFIIMCIGFGTLAAIEYDDPGRWVATPFSSLTQVVIGTGTASGLLSLFVTEIGRAIVTFSTWLAEKLNANLERGKAKIRDEGIEVGIQKGRVEGRVEGRAEGVEYGRTLVAFETEGKEPPPPPWETGG